MYLTELYRFYERMSADPNSGMPPIGMSAELISYVFEIDGEGRLAGRPIDIRNDKGRPATLFVPASVKRSSNIAPNFLWDNSGYVLGVDAKGKKGRTQETYKIFKQFNRSLLQKCTGESARAFLRFLDLWTPEMFESLDDKESILDANIVFRLKGSERLLHEDRELKEIWLKTLEDEQSSDDIAPCLITGRHAPVALTHPSIKGLPGTQSSGAALVSFNCPAFGSFGKSQSANAPVSKEAARAYVSALNYLLQREHRQVVNFPGTSIVFWTDGPTSFQTLFGDLFDLSDNSKEAQSQEHITELRGLLDGIRRGDAVVSQGFDLDGSARYFVLGLAPNAARISVRFWMVDTIGHFVSAWSEWYDDLSVVKTWDSDPDYPPMWLLLKKALAAQEKNENVPNMLVGQLVQCGLVKKRHIPESVFSVILQRIHADKRMDYFRAALIKAYLIRNCKEVKNMVSLNQEETSKGYRLGRLFAVLEKAQTDALGGNINAPLRERYIGSASSTPRVVFPMLMRLVQHHVTKVRKSGQDWYEAWFAKLVGEIVDGMTEYPAVLSLEDQGRFMLGYYHQRTALYTKKVDAEETATSGK